LDELAALEVFAGAPERGIFCAGGGGELVSFTVMVRPIRGLQKPIELMALQLATGEP